MARPTGSGKGLSVTASVRLTRSEARTLREKYGSLPKALRRGVDLLLKPPRARLTPPPTDTDLISHTTQQGQPHDQDTTDILGNQDPQGAAGPSPRRAQP